MSGWWVVALRSSVVAQGRKRLAFTLEQKIQIISEIEGGKTKSDVSRELGLASSTVATIWKNRDSILSAYGSEALLREEVPSLLESERPKANQDSLLSLENMVGSQRERLVSGLSTTNQCLRCYSVVKAITSPPTRKTNNILTFIELYISSLFKK